ncbi:MAG: universal stress protein [Bacteroidales bacterium]|jgi:nucleotide-binding universal stress UspA family protein|nr:universal stress protein [Bacteroidales bacterium]
MKNLLALFYSPIISKEFVRYASCLARDLNASVKLVFVQNPQVIPLVAPRDAAATGDHIRKEIADLAKSVKKSVDEIIRDIREEVSAEIKIEYRAETGSVVQILEDYNSMNKVEMVLVEGEPDKPFWIQTNTNYDLIENAKCPVLIVEPNKKYRPLEKIVYATDYKEEDIKTLKKLVRLTKPFVTDILVLHITESLDFEEKVKQVGFNQMLKQKVGFKNISFKVLMDKKEKETLEIINDQLEKTDTDLIVVLKENQNFFERIFKSSFTTNVLKNVNLPVLIFHNEQ